MDALIAAAAQALAAADPLGALNHVALRNDAPALALRGMAMAQLGNLARARELLKAAARAFGPHEAVARARCAVADAEIALVSRELVQPARSLAAARAVLQAHGDWLNAAHARHLEARHLLLIGHLDAAERMLAEDMHLRLPPSARALRELVAAGIAIRRLQMKDARAALERARHAARQTASSVLQVEVQHAVDTLNKPAARLLVRGAQDTLRLDEVEVLLASEAFVVDACRHTVRDASATVSLASRPVLFALLRMLAEAWPQDVPRERLLAGAFRAREADESYRARLRVEIGRLRAELRGLAEVRATRQGFLLEPCRVEEVAVLAPMAEEPHAGVLALLADGEAWSSSALALALNASPRTVQRSLERLAEAGKVQALGRGRARRWVVPAVPGFPTSLLLPGSLAGGLASPHEAISS